MNYIFCVLPGIVFYVTGLLGFFCRLEGKALRVREYSVMLNGLSF